MRRWASKKDLVHNDLARCHRQLGDQVYDTHKVGDGFPDMLVVHPDGPVILVETKTPGGKLTEAEVKFHVEYRGPIEIEETITDVFRTHRKYKGEG